MISYMMVTCHIVVTLSCNTEKNIEGFGIDNII